MVTLEGSNDRFRLLYDVKGRFVLHRISEEEAQVRSGFVDVMVSTSCARW